MGQQGKNNSSCRFCGSPLQHTLVDLGMSPLCESYIAAEQLNQVECFYPLHVFVCGECFLVQLQEYVRAEDIFSHYAYFSSYSDSWVEHAKAYANQMIDRFHLDANSQVVEIASNDGYLLQHFVARRIPVVGVEPAVNIAEVACERNIPTLVKFFGTRTAQELVAEGKQADLLLGNNVLAQVPDLGDFVEGMKQLLKAQGVITMEFPHLLRLIEENQFDTIYHEHFSYFSLTTVEKIFAAHRLALFDVEELPTHGGSLRIYARHDEDTSKPMGHRIRELREREAVAGIGRLAYYAAFEEKVRETKRGLMEFLIGVKREGKSVAAYGAPGKGNTLLNYCGIRTDFIDYAVDRNSYKQGKFTPGTHIPICQPQKIRETKPDFLLIMPWNLKEEVIEQTSYIREWGAQFVVAIPHVQVYS